MSQKKVCLADVQDKNDDDDSALAREGSKRSSTIESKYKSLVWEKRILVAAFAMGVLATVMFIISFSTEFWIWVRLEKPEVKYDRGSRFLKTGHYHGLWKICREELWYVNVTRTNETYPVLYCRKMFFSLPEDKKRIWSVERVNMESKMLDFRRSTIAVGFIALMLAFLAHTFTFYSLDQLRYMYKRLAGCLHLLTGASCWVTLEVFRQMHMYEERNMKTFVPEFSEIRYGWSYNLIWFELILYVIPGIVLLACSRKKKRSKARSLKEARENEPVVLGR